ncbi:MAG: hypothetical protein AAGA53_14830 [Pseudomonadota bacterium]
MKQYIAMIAVILPFSATPAHAGKEDFIVCRDALPTAAQEIANRVAVQLKPGVDAKQIMKSTVIDMVKSGEIERKTAKQSATSAAECLMKLKS